MHIGLALAIGFWVVWVAIIIYRINNKGND